VDAVVLAVRTVPVDEEFLVGTTRTVLDIAAELGIRVLVVGGAGALRSPDDSHLLVADNTAFVPAGVKAVAAAGIAQLRTCRSHAEADWVYVSPPALLEPSSTNSRLLGSTTTSPSSTAANVRQREPGFLPFCFMRVCPGGWSMPLALPFPTALPTGWVARGELSTGEWSGSVGAASRSD
jgi:hypothetical protein